jgi:hypothetical protein
MTDPVHALVRLRLAVAVLGEERHAGWWRSHFLSEAGLDSLEYNFPRSPLTAGFTATCLAAKRLHDERIGRTGVTHLFRLDPDLEIRVQRTASLDSGALLKGFSLDRESAMEELALLAGDEIDSPEGPVQVGLLDEAATDRGLAEMARHYHAGFRLGLRVYPYFATRR